MIYIAVALTCEARPLIERYGLKQDRTMKRFRVYAADRIRLIITGTGGTDAVIATVYLLTYFRADERDIFVNFGSCGCRSAQTGDLFAAASVRRGDGTSARYPDLLLKLPLREANLITADTVSSADPVSESGPGSLPILRDMEGAYVYDAAIPFIPSHRLFLIKIVSDREEPEKVTAASLENLVREALTQIDEAIQQMIRWELCLTAQAENSGKEKSQEKAISDLSGQLRLTFYQKHELEGLYRMCEARRKDPLRVIQSVLSCVESMTGIEKRERNRLYGEIRRKLTEP